MPETWVQSLVQEYPLEKGMDTHTGILIWRIPWTEEPGQLQSMRSQRVRQDWALTHLFVCSWHFNHTGHVWVSRLPQSFWYQYWIKKRNQQILLFHLPKTHNLEVCGCSRALINGFKLIQKTQSIVPCHLWMTVCLLTPPHLAPSSPQLTHLHQNSPTFFEGDSITERFIRVPSSWLFR